MDKSTEDLQSELTAAHSFNDFCSRNKNELEFPSASAYLNYLLEAKNITKAELANSKVLERSYIYHILSGDKKASRDKLIILAIAAKADITEIQNLLKYAKERPLYVRDRRDGLIYFGIKSGKSIIDINVALLENGLAELK